MPGNCLCLARSNGRGIWANERVVVFKGEIKHPNTKELKVVLLDAKNYAKYKKDILKIAKKLPQQWPVEGLVNLAIGPSHIGYVAFVDGKLAGYIICEVKGKLPARYLYIWTVGGSVRGLGNIILLFIAKEAQRRDISVIEVTVPSHNSELLNFLSKRGFVVKKEKYSILPTLKADTLLVIKKAEERMGRNFVTEESLFSGASKQGIEDSLKQALLEINTFL